MGGGAASSVFLPEKTLAFPPFDMMPLYRLNPLTHPSPIYITYIPLKYVFTIQKHPSGGPFVLDPFFADVPILIIANHCLLRCL